MNKKMFLGNNKKGGLNDIGIITIILFIFFGTAFLIPHINTSFGTDASTFDTGTVSSDVLQDGEQLSQGTLSGFGVLDVFRNVLLLAFFDFGGTLGLPVWLQLFYTLMAVVLILVVARNLWIGGGA